MEKKLNWNFIYKLENISILIVLIILCFGKNVWYDESFSISLMDEKVLEIIRYTASDVHPPFYYLYLKLFSALFGTSIFVLHLASVIPFMGLLLLFGSSIKKQYGANWAVVSVFLLAGAPRVLNFALEIRMYSWAMFFVLLSFLIAKKVYETQKTNVGLWLWFGVVNALAAYTHYFAAAAVMIISFLLAISLCIKKRKKDLIWWGGSSFFTILLYIPWLLVFYRQLKKVEQDYWIAPFQIGELKEYSNLLFGTNKMIHLIVLFVFSFAVFLYLARKDIGKDVMPFVCFVIVFGFIGLGVGLCVFVTPVFIQRYIIIVIPVFWYGITKVFCNTNNKVIFYILALISLVCFYKSYEAQFYKGMSKDHQTAVTFMEDNFTETDVLLTDSTHFLGPISIYEPDVMQWISADLIADEAFQSWNEIGNVSYYESLKDFNQDEFFVMVESETFIDTIKDCGYEIKDMGTYTIPYDGWVTDHLEGRIYYCRR